VPAVVNYRCFFLPKTRKPLGPIHSSPHLTITIAQKNSHFKNPLSKSWFQIIADRLLGRFYTQYASKIGIASFNMFAFD